jgi:hypothetical protein
LKYYLSFLIEKKGGNYKKGSASFIQAAKLAESEGTLRASWKRPGLNPGP